MVDSMALGEGPESPFAKGLPVRSRTLPLSSLQITGIQGDKQSRINGEYYETPPYACGRPPVYRQKGGEYYLYFSDTTSQWFINTGEAARDRLPTGFVHSRPAAPGACPSEARGWIGEKTHQPSLMVAPIALTSLEDFLSDEACTPGGSRDRTESDVSPMRRTKTWRDTADRGWGDGGYKFGDVTRGVIRKVQEVRRSTRHGQDVAIVEMESVTELSEARKNTMDVEKMLFAGMDADDPSSFFVDAVK